jgi:hypothetical protein
VKRKGAPVRSNIGILTHPKLQKPGPGLGSARVAVKLGKAAGDP